MPVLDRLTARLLAPALALALLGAAVLPAAAQDVLSAAQARAVDERIRAYLLENPEVIIEAMQVLEARQEAEKNARVSLVIKNRHAEIFEDPDSVAVGPEDADVTLVEFFDYLCGYCKMVRPTLIELARTDPRLRIVYKELPILGPGSVIASRAAIASRSQGLYAAFHDALLASRERTMDEPTVMKIAADVGLDVATLKRDMDNPAIEGIIAANRKLAAELGMEGTPSFVVGDTVIGGSASLEELQGAVAQARQATDPTAAAN